MLHLLPHALSAPRAASGGHAHEDGDLHVIGVGKGLMALAGLYTFFAIERLLPFINGLRARKVGNRRRYRKEERKEGRKKGRKEGRKEGIKEGRKEGRQEGRKEERKKGRKEGSKEVRK
jgi:hypothetical protein